MSALGSPATRAGASYFALVFAAGFALGVVRQLWVVPVLGERLAELAEMPLMLVAIVLAARWTSTRFGLARAARPRLAAGAIALALLLAAELTLVLALRGSTIADYVASRDPVSGTVYLVMLGIFAAMPALLRRVP
ncbi:MAG TPA: hypothetical protein VLD39_10085 [Gammaproteobacteria bacterium]|nr:hypothetical protein [Gammaproteobacteria bacterium]